MPKPDEEAMTEPTLEEDIRSLVQRIDPSLDPALDRLIAKLREKTIKHEAQKRYNADLKDKLREAEREIQMGCDAITHYQGEVEKAEARAGRLESAIERALDLPTVLKTFNALRTALRDARREEPHAPR